MSEETPFRTVLRGYDPEQVRSALDELQTSVVSARRMTADRTIELTRMQEQLAKAERDLEAATTKLREQESHPAHAGTPSVTDVGARIGSMLALANEEAEELRAAGREDARRRREEADASIATAHSDAERDAQQLRAAARQDAEQLRAVARQDAERLVEEARRTAAEVVDGASRDADVSRAEAKAILDRHRAQAEAVAAFRTQVDRHADRLQQASTRVEQLAQEETDLIKRQAQENTERIRQDTDNQLAAVDARKHSITAQLDTVGTLLKELGQATDAAARTGEPDGSDGAHSGAASVASDAPTEPDGQGRPEEAGARH